jgi:peptidoglycan/xylan/chitin deacetylase (PgdA/CDA1 family)/uncharacterized caspase-like protein
VNRNARRLIPVAVASWVATLFLAAAPAAAQSTSAPEPARILDLYRKVLVVLDQAAVGDASSRGRLESTARKAYHAKQTLLRDFAARSTGDPTLARELADYLRDPSLDPVDRLAFDDLVDEVLGDEPRRSASTEGALGELETQRRELERTRTSLGDEVKRGRGASERERWGRYLAGLRESIDVGDVMREFPPLPGLAPTFRGRSPYGENARFGYDLPPKHLVLTFDDGPHPRYTEQVLDALEKSGVTAYFFTVGQNLGSIRADSSIVWTKASVWARIAHEAGHRLANHSYSHPQMPKLQDEARRAELSTTSRLLEEIVGAPPALFRPPYGDTTRELTDEYASMGLTSVLWNLDSWDWGDPVPESIVERVVERVEKAGRGILLFHDVHKQTVEALPSILEELTARGYVFSTLEGLPAPEPKLLTTPDGARAVSDADTVVDTETRPHYRRSHALVVGINEYRQWPRLQYAVNDATAVASALVDHYGFQRENVTVLIDQEATRDRIVEILSGALASPTRVGPDDRVLVFFAGHGATRKLPSGKELGYIVPVDAELGNYQIRAISMTELKDYSDLIPAKHVYFIMDSCYSGLALTRGGGGTGGYVDEITGRRARQILTAGGADQAVADNGPAGHSIFTWTLLQGLQGLADLDGNGILTASELGAFAAPIVSKFSHQTPVFGNLEGSEGGEFVFELEPEQLSEVSRALDRDALAMSEELEGLQRELASKLQRNLEIHRRLDTVKNEHDAESGIPEAERLAQANRHHALGLQYFREGRHALALEELIRAVGLNPGNPTIVNNYGFVLYRMGRYQESLPWFERTIELDPQRAVVYVNLADALRKLGRDPEAEPYYRKYLDLWPESPRRAEIEELLR